MSLAGVVRFLVTRAQGFAFGDIHQARVQQFGLELIARHVPIVQVREHVGKVRQAPQASLKTSARGTSLSATRRQRTKNSEPSGIARR